MHIIILLLYYYMYVYCSCYFVLNCSGNKFDEVIEVAKAFSKTSVHLYIIGSCCHKDSYDAAITAFRKEKLPGISKVKAEYHTRLLIIW
jgi:hypothetical protein